MFRVTPPDGTPVDGLFETLEAAMWEMEHYMHIPDSSWDTALKREERGAIRFHFGNGCWVGHIEAVVH